MLLQSGLHWCTAACFNLFSALTAVIGFFIAVSISTDQNSREWLFTVAAGMFIYIALADMVSFR